MSNQGFRHYLHYDRDRVDYSVTPYELERLKNATQNDWKDYSFGALGVGVPCLINAAARHFQQNLDASFYLNLIFGLIALSLGFAFLIFWKQTKTDVEELIKAIQSKPKVLVPSIADFTTIKEEPKSDSKQ